MLPQWTSVAIVGSTARIPCRVDDSILMSDATALSEEIPHKDIAQPATNGAPKLKKHRIVIVGLGMVAIAFMFVAPRPLLSLCAW